MEVAGSRLRDLFRLSTLRAWTASAANERSAADACRCVVIVGDRVQRGQVSGSDAGWAVVDSPTQSALTSTAALTMPHSSRRSHSGHVSRDADVTVTRPVLGGSWQSATLCHTSSHAVGSHMLGELSTHATRCLHCTAIPPRLHSILSSSSQSSTALSAVRLTLVGCQPVSASAMSDSPLSLSSPSTPQLCYQPLQSPPLESSQLPSKLPSIGPPSRHTHIHIHSHYPTHSSSTSPNWTLSSSPSSSPFSVRFSSFNRPASSASHFKRRCTSGVLLKLFVAACLLLAVLLYQTHLCMLADISPQSPLSLIHSSLPASLHHHQSHTSSPLLSLSSLSSLSSLPVSSHSSDYLLDPWQSRLLPIAVEMEQSFAWLVINLMLLTGYAHAPPIYDGAVCVMREGVRVDSGNEQCVDSRLRIQWNEQYIVRVTTAVSVTADPTSNFIDAPPPPSPPFVQEWLWLSHGHIDHMLQQSPAEVIVAAATANRTIAATLLTSASALAAAIMPTVARVRVVDLVPAFTYTFAVSLSNGTHFTRPLHSLPTPALDQRSLFARERQRLTRYLNLVSDTASNPPPPLSPPLPFRHPVPVSPTRVMAPFEAAERDDRCPAAFQRWVSDYRAFHAGAVARLMAARGDVHELYHLINGTSEQASNETMRGIRLLVSGVYRWSGVTDRTSAFTGLYVVAMLTRRVLLLDADWPDIQRVLLSPLTLPIDIVAPQLRHLTLDNLTQYVPVTDIGPETDDYDAHYHGQIVYITSIKGIIMRLLTESRSYSPLLSSLGLTPDNAVGCIAHSLWHLRLSSLLYYQHYQTALLPLLSPDTAAIGIQIRSWHDYVFLSQANETKAGKSVKRDDIAVEAESSVERHSDTITRFGDQGFFHCAQDVTDTLALPPSAASSAPIYPKQPVWYLVSDDEAMRAAAVVRWGQREGGSSGGRPYLLTLLSKQLLGHTNAVDLDLGFLFLRHALVEQFLFSLCDFHIVSLSSGYGRWPALLALRKRRIFVIANDQQNVTTKAASTCMDVDRGGMSILQLAGEWSKV